MIISVNADRSNTFGHMRPAADQAEQSLRQQGGTAVDAVPFNSLIWIVEI